MGVYINMEMPTSCRACMFSRTDIRNVDWCVLTEKDLPCDCPIIPVQPHGRLIDADAFIKEECNSCDGACESIPCDCLNCAADCRCDFMKDIADAPTIIPAEEGE